MVVKQEIEKEIGKSAEDVYKNILTNAINESWQIVRVNKIEAKSGAIYEILGVTAPFSGITVKQVFMEDVASMVPVFIQIKTSGKSKSGLYAVASGSENLFGWDFGRNKKVVNKILDFSKKPAQLTKVNLQNIPKDRIRCLKCGYDNHESVMNMSGHCEKCDASLPSRQEIAQRREINKLLEELS